MKKLFRGKKKKPASEAGSIASGINGSGYNISPKKDLGKLHKAAFEGDVTKLKSLLKRGDVNQLDKENRTPLHLACASGKYEVVRMLSDHHNINLNLCDNDRRSALMKCVQCEHQTCLSILLGKEADVSLCDVNGNTALHIAASIPNPDICFLLSDYHADPWAKNKDGATPLHIVAGLGNDELVAYFLDAGVRIDDQDNNKKTPLMYAAHKGHITTVKLLLSKNANSALRDSNGWTADDYASMDGFHPISHIIVEHNTKQNAKGTPSKRSLSSNTPHTTPQKLGARGGISPKDSFMPSLGGPALDAGDAFSQSDDDSQSASKISKARDSWGSSESEEEHVYAKIDKRKPQEKPKINVLQAMNLKKQSPAQTVTPQKNEAPVQTMPKATNLFMTSSARQQLAQRQSRESSPEQKDTPEDRGIRARYDSRSAKGLPVSPAKPPVPRPRVVDSMADSEPDGGYSPSRKSKQPEEKESDWDSTEDESEGERDQRPPATAKPTETTPDKKVLMGQLGFDEDDVNNLYGKEDTDTDFSRSEALPAENAAKKTTLPEKQVKNASKGGGDESDSWDDDTDSEQKTGNAQKIALNYIAKSSAMKFDDETNSESEFEEPVKSSPAKPTAKAEIHNQDDSSSYDSDNLVVSPAKSGRLSSTPVGLSPAKKQASPQRQLPSLAKSQGSGDRTKQEAELKRKRMEDLGIIYGDEDSVSEESEFESESSWERENRSKKPQLMNNQRDLEKERLRKEEEDRKLMVAKKLDEERREREQQQMLEAQRRKVEEENRRKQEEERLEEERKRKEREREEQKRKLEEEQMRREREREEQKRKLEEEQRRKQEKERQRRQEEERLEEERKRNEREEEQRKRNLEELDKLNKMNAELERKNAELKMKMVQDNKRKQEDKKREEERLATLKTAQMNESLRTALERAVEDDSESGDSNTESIDDDLPKKREKSPQLDYPKHSHSPLRMSNPTPTSGRMFALQDPTAGPAGSKSKELDIEALSETETDDELSVSESHAPATLHASALSDSLKLAEEKQSLSMRLAHQEDIASSTQERLDKMERENKDLRMKERMLAEEKKVWELVKVDLLSEKRKLSFEVKNLQESLETVNLKLSQLDERSKRLQEQVKVERDEKRELEVTVRDLKMELKSSDAVTKQLELDCNEMKRLLQNEQGGKSLANQMDSDAFNLSKTLEDEKAKEEKATSLEQVILGKNQELVKVKADRDRFEDTSNRYKDELAKLRSDSSDQHSNFAVLNQELNEKLDEKEVELRESEEALQLAALQSVQFKQAYENGALQLAEAKREKESALKDLQLEQSQKEQLKQDLEASRSSLLREQERVRKHEETLEKLREKEADLQTKLLSAETRASRFENEVGVAQSSSLQRVEERAKLENDCEKLRIELREREKELADLKHENARQAGAVEALKVELSQSTSECSQLRREREDARTRNTLSVTDQQEKFNEKLAAMHREHENERVAFETRNAQLTEQVEHWKSESHRIERERVHKDEELAQAQQDRIEAHKKLGYADAFSKSASQEQKLLMEENTKFKEDNIKLQSQVSLLEQKLDEKSSTAADLQREVDSYYQASATANRQIDSLNETQRLAESGRMKIEEQLKDIELENIRLKSELESAKSWKERLQQSREEEAHSKAQLEEKVSSLECDKLLTEEKLATEVANGKMLRSEADGHRSMWEQEVKARSKLAVDLSRAENEVEEERRRIEATNDKLARALEDRKTYKTKYEHMKRNKLDSEKRAESYRSAMHEAGRRTADVESDRESQISQMDAEHNEEKGRLENTVSRLREQVADLTQRAKEPKTETEYREPSSPERSDELKRSKYENEKLKEELRRLRAHVEASYVDRSELEAARQEERIKAQAALTPTLDQVNSYLKDRQMAQEIVDQLRQKNEESRYLQAVRKIGTLEEEVASLKRRTADGENRKVYQKEAEISRLYENSRKENEVLQYQLGRMRDRVDDYKASLVKEKRKFHSLFSSTLGGSFIPNGDSPQLAMTNGLSPSIPGLTSTPLPVGRFSSTPKKDTSDPLLAQLRSKLDVSISQHLATPSNLNVNGHAGLVTPASSAGTPRSDRSSHNQLSREDVAGPSRHRPTSNEYMSFLIS